MIPPLLRDTFRGFEEGRKAPLASQRTYLDRKAATRYAVYSTRVHGLMDYLMGILLIPEAHVLDRHAAAHEH